MENDGVHDVGHCICMQRIQVPTHTRSRTARPRPRPWAGLELASLELASRWRSRRTWTHSCHGAKADDAAPSSVTGLATSPLPPGGRTMTRGPRQAQRVSSLSRIVVQVLCSVAPQCWEGHPASTEQSTTRSVRLPTPLFLFPTACAENRNRNKWAEPTGTRPRQRNPGGEAHSWPEGPFSSFRTSVQDVSNCGMLPPLPLRSEGTRRQ